MKMTIRLPKAFVCLAGVILFFTFSTKTYAQNVSYVRLELTWFTTPQKANITISDHSDGNILLKLEKTLSSARGLATSTEAQWKISNEQFDLIKYALYKIKPADLLSGGPSSTLDGYDSKISFSHFNERIVYSSSNPDSNVKERKLDDYNAAIKLILKTAGLNPDDFIPLR